MQGEWVGGRFKSVFGGHYAGETQYTADEIERREAAYAARDERAEMAGSDLTAAQPGSEEWTTNSEGDGSRTVTPDGGPLLNTVGIQPVGEGTAERQVGSMLPVEQGGALVVDTGGKL